MVDRKGDHRPMTRTKCPGRLHVLLDYKIFMWRVSIFDETHNHELTPVNHVHRMVRYHVMSNLDKAQVDSLSCRSLGNLSADPILMDLARLHKLDIMEEIRSRVSFGNFLLWIGG